MNLDALLKTMVKQDGSDIFIAVGAPPSMTAKGKFVRIGSENLSADKIQEMAFSLMREDQIEEFSRTMEMNLAHSIPGVGRFRVNVMQQRNTISMVIRQIKLNILTLEDLNLPPVITDLAMLERGLVLVTGSTGSGKSTTLAAIINHRNANKGGHIITIEDPLEFIHSHKKSIVTQREIGMDTLSYNNSLKSALRQAPDVMLIGEIRDRETMEAAISFADTGHLVFSTLHSNNANQTLERILNFFPTDEHPMIYMQLSLNLNGVVCQRLIPKIDGKGRVAILEIMLNSPRVADLIHKGETGMLKGVIASSTHEGMQTFDQHLYDLHKEGIIDFDTALRAADSANDLKLKIKMEEDGAFETDGLALEDEKSDEDIFE
ncbi:MAG: PilT/PilU family type 4a pilus ATPase [bacterium]|nr:PilT/PilU family type 4a pilus ATPase [bacterium]